MIKYKYTINKRLLTYTYIYIYKHEDNKNVVSSGKSRSRFVVPGPGAYDINVSSIKRSSPRFSFGTKVIRKEFNL